MELMTHYLFLLKEAVPSMLKKVLEKPRLGDGQGGRNTE